MRVSCAVPGAPTQEPGEDASEQHLHSMVGCQMLEGGSQKSQLWLEIKEQSSLEMSDMLIRFQAGKGEKLRQ